GRYPVAAEHHLARDFRVTALVVEEAGKVEADRVERGGAERQRDRARAREGAYARRDPCQGERVLLPHGHPGSLGDGKAKVNVLAKASCARYDLRTSPGGGHGS